MGTYLLWTLLGLGAIVLLIVLFTFLSKDNGRGPGSRADRRGRDGDAGDGGPGTP
jgi:hypothetical protein